MALDNQSPELFGQTPSQTVGPFFHYGLPWKGGADLVGDSDLGARAELMPPEHFLLKGPTPKAAVRGEVIELIGQVRDADGQPVPDAMIEIWQADASGRYGGGNEPDGFVGFGRSARRARPASIASGPSGRAASRAPATCCRRPISPSACSAAAC